MSRLHLFEIEDQPWLPEWIRDGATGFLLLSHEVGKLNELFLPKIKSILKKTSRNHIYDLGSGAGGPLPSILEELHKDDSTIRLTLTDLYPNQQAIKRFNASGQSSSISYLESAVDATNVPGYMLGLRTMIGAFHHLPENIALNVLKNAQENKEPIAIFEGFGRNLKSFMLLLPSVFMAFLLMPFVKPFRIRHLIFTYVIPIFPLIVFFDGWVSFLRIYSKSELEGLISKLPEDNQYEWTIGEVGMQSAPYIIGIPVVTKS